jgi:hypothetical protein
VSRGVETGVVTEGRHDQALNRKGLPHGKLEAEHRHLTQQNAALVEQKPPLRRKRWRIRPTACVKQ